MSGDSNETKPNDAPHPSQNPEGEIPKDPTSGGPHEGRNVSGDEAEAAGRRAAADESVTREEVVEQSAYQDDAADLGQQAASSEESKKTP